MYIRLTGLSLAVAFAQPHAWIVPVLVANSVTGYVYMTFEETALELIGSKGLEWYIFGKQLKLTRQHRAMMNMVTHLLLPALACARIRRVPYRLSAPLAFVVAYALTVDLTSVYPSEHGLRLYVGIYAVTFTIALCM